MLNLILATEATTTYAGDDLMTVALMLGGVAMLVTAIATVIVTPSGDHH